MNYFLKSLSYESEIMAKYANFHRLPGFVLLESTDKTRGRYDILSAFPKKKIMVSNADIDDLTALKAYLKTPDYTLNLPFQGGLMGYVSYDYACEQASVPFGKPLSALPQLALGLYDWAIITDHWEKKVTLFAALWDEETEQLMDEVLRIWSQKPSSVSASVGQFKPLLNNAHYEEQFAEIQKALRMGRCYQVNYTQPFLSTYSGDPWCVYENLRKKNPVPYAAFLAIENNLVLSFSPERFITQDKGLIKTSPIKGTIERSSNLKEDQRLKEILYYSEKNRAENIMIVDLLRNDFAKIAKTGTVSVDELWSIESYQKLHHLVSHIRAETDAHPLDVLKACFPGGSITGAPKLEAMRVISELEPYARSIYCGSILYLSHHGKMDSNLAIRTMIATDDELILSAGGGVVIDSDCQDEYQECLTKIAAITQGLVG